VTNNIHTQASSKANPQCKKETTASDGQGTKNGNTHHKGEKPPKNFTQLYQIAIPPNITQTARNKKKEAKALAATIDTTIFLS